MGMEIGSIKRNRCRKCGLPWTAHLLCFGTVKTVPGLCEMDKNCPCVVCLKWYEMNGLIFVELDRLRHYFNVLVQ